MQGPRSGHRHGQVGIDRPENRRDVFEHRHAFGFPASGGSGPRRSGHADARGRGASGELRRRNRGNRRAARNDQAAGAAHDHADRPSEVHDWSRKRRHAGRQRQRRSLLAQPRADGFDDGGHGHGRRAGRFAARPPRIQPRRFRRLASGRAAGQETFAR